MSGHPTPAPAIVALSAMALPLARRIRDGLGAGDLFLAGDDIAPDVQGFDGLAPTLQRLFLQQRPIVAVMATGIVIRALAPLLADKQAEPPVLCVSADGRTIVPLLGGHHGANATARRLADVLGGTAAVTTAGDCVLGFAVDEPPPGWRLDRDCDARGLAAALLAGAAVRDADAPPWFSEVVLPRAANGTFAVVERLDAAPPRPDEILYRPQRLAIGVGCERNAAPETLERLVAETLRDANLSRGCVAVIASIDVKSDEPAIRALERTLDRPIRFFDAATLEAETPHLANPSRVVFEAVGCHGVAEASALAAAGPDARLIVPKRKGSGVTVAIARAVHPIDARRVGRDRGRLAIVGTGPGTPAWRTAESERLVAEATDLVGYSFYLDLLGPAAAGKTRHDFAMGTEEDRVRAALDLAAAGRSVALVCSGDPQIYALATLVFELLDRGGRPDWKRIAIAVAPGISALQAASARAGAIIGHDFCAISLSDLLTPWPAIEQRLTAAAEGDFVVAFYNPVSRRRRHQLARAREILLQHRPAETPVLVARQMGRPDERITRTTLGALTVDMADMFTVVLVGNRQTRVVAGAADTAPWVYTPRGYADRNDGVPGETAS